ncbi:hypothetical protein [Aliiglaciecola litoralis]|uniref:Uncharacterized protein n=1 Tax=Aliiglaciecola litoralis TaxID=582857 RepID=A0ABN1LHJ9_9ALTE
MQAELSKLKLRVKSLDSQHRFSLNALIIASGQLQNMYLMRLEYLQKHALISSEDHKFASFIVGQVENVIMQCCEKRFTVEEVITKALKKTEMEMPQISQYIAKQPSDIRIPWCKNTIGGFVTACHNLTSEHTRQRTSAEPDISANSGH